MRALIVALLFLPLSQLHAAVSCGYVNGVFTCSDGESITSQYCTTVDGILTCTDDPQGAKSQAVGEIDGENAATVAESTLEVQGGFFSDLMEFFKGALLWVPRWIWQQVLGVLGALVQAIPAPAAFASFASTVGSVGGSVLWFLGLIEFKFGVTVVLGALASRWLLRRIPLIG